MSDESLTLEAQHQAEKELLREELTQRDTKILELEAELQSLRSCKTWPPTEDTGEQTKAKECAHLLQRVDNLESRESDRAGAIQELNQKFTNLEGKVDQIIARLEQYPVVDSNDIKAILDTLKQLPCLQKDNCPDDEPKKATRLSIAASGG